MSERAPYKNAPLVSVAFELRHPTSETLSAKQRASIRASLGDRFPIMRSHQNTTQMVQLIPGGPAAAQSASEEFPKFFNRAQTVAMTFTQTQTIVETSDYPGWDSFRKTILLACEVRNGVSPIYGVERVGLRYIDEVRPAEGTELHWSEWIQPSLLAPSADVGLPVRAWQGIGVYGKEPGRSLVLRYGPGEGYAVDPNAELRRKRKLVPGPFFLLDIDSFWVPEEGVPPYDRESISERTDELHGPVRTAFESAITERLRNEVLDR